MAGVGCFPSPSPATNDETPLCAVTEASEAQNKTASSIRLQTYSKNLKGLQLFGLDGSKSIIRVIWCDRYYSEPVSLDRAKKCVESLTTRFNAAGLDATFVLDDSDYKSQKVKKGEIEYLRDALEVRKSYGIKARNELWIITADLSYWGDHGVAGHTIFPDERTAEIDGVLIDPKFIDSQSGKTSYKDGDTLVHEAGHWLGLNHPCGKGCKPQDDNDGIADTPICKGNCPPKDVCELRNSCKVAGVTDPCNNYLEYGGDSCREALTDGQITLMKANLAAGGSRSPVSDATFNNAIKMLFIR